MQVCGGSPEGVVAAVLLGFNRVIYVGDAKEIMWMNLPTEEEEKMHNIDYTDFVSPNIDSPDQGFLAAEAVVMLAPFVHNHVTDTPGALKIASPIEIMLPPIKNYIYIGATGRVIMRTIMPGQASNATEERKASKPKAGTSKENAASNPSGPGSSKGSVPPETPKAKGSVNADEEDVDAEEDLMDEDEEAGIDEDLAQLEALEAGGGSGATTQQPKKRGRPKSANTPTPKKAKTKAAATK